MIPCSGDFHYQFHVASGVNRVAYAPLLQWFVNEADMSKTIKDKMDDTCHMKHIDHFYQLIIKFILVSFSSVPCLVSTVPFPMTSPYVGAGRHFFLKPSSDPLTLSLRPWHALTGRE